uniref:MARVEL domain-containing protein n=1 Tax=Rhabditophanes sp. KR3021 TaxID=114890 RepID=A0AC35THC6_9BILA
YSANLAFPAHSSKNNINPLTAEESIALRKQSDTTLNRLILVAQLLEHEVEFRHRSEINAARIVKTIRIANTVRFLYVLLLVINVLIGTGVGSISYDNMYESKEIWISVNKWHLKNHTTLPLIFGNMNLYGQYICLILTVTLFFITIVVQFLHCCNILHTKSACLGYSIGATLYLIVLFVVQVHYSSCPFLETYANKEQYYESMPEEDYVKIPECSINGWAIAAILSLFSCGLFVSEAFITAFFRLVWHSKSVKLV